jgi:hypothetical protein
VFAVWKQEQDGVVLRQVDRLERSAVAEPELRARLDEERDVGAEAVGEVEEKLVRRRVREQPCGEHERSGSIGASAAEAGGDRDTLLDRRSPARLDMLPPRCPGRAPDERVVLEPVHRAPAHAQFAVSTAGALRIVATSCRPSSRVGPMRGAGPIFAGAGALSCERGCG